MKNLILWLTFLSCLWVDWLFPLRILLNKVDRKWFDEDVEAGISWCWELGDEGSAGEGRDEGQMLCFNCWNLDVLRGILCKPEVVCKFAWFVICIGVVFGGLYELRCGFLCITVILLLIGTLDEGVDDNCDIDKCCILLLAKLASTWNKNVWFL